MPIQRHQTQSVFRNARRHGPWTLLGITLLVAVLSFPFAAAQPYSSVSPAPSSSSSPSSTGGVPPQQQPSPSPTPPTPPLQPQPLPPGTRELRDGIVLADTVALGQGQTYHLSLVAQPQNLPVRRQLERIIHTPLPYSTTADDVDSNPILLDKRQAVPSGTTLTTTSAPSPPSLTSPATAPTRAIGPASLPPPGRDGTYPVYISVSTCLTPKSSDSAAAVCPPLVLYVSTSAGEPLPGPGKNPDIVKMVTSSEGLITYTAHVKNDLFFSVYSPAMQGSWTGGWSIEVGASTQGFAQRFDSAPGLVLDDTDATNASLLTHNFTVGSVPTFKVYLVPFSQYPAGLSQSLCAIDAIQSPLTKATMTVTETNRATYLDTPSTYGVLPGDPNPQVYGQRRQVRINSLQAGTEYLALFMADVLQQSGAEVLYHSTRFRTKRHDNCLLLTDLSFCQEVAYSVPVTSLSRLTGGSSTVNSSSQLLAEVGKLYDDFAHNLMDNFNKVLGQYDCTRARYSLIRDCDDCTRAYRRWLCSVSIPRCTDTEDVQDPANVGYREWATVTEDDLKNPYLKAKDPGPVVMPRNTTNTRDALSQLQQAKNPLLNPGDYGEVLPCIDLCYDVVQSCPSFLGFNCPSKNMAGYYAPMRSQGFQCNGLGLVSIPSTSSATGLMVHGSSSSGVKKVAIAVASVVASVTWIVLF